MSKDNQLKGSDSIGEAWLDDSGTIHMHLSRTSDGQDLNAVFTYLKTDPNYEKILQHLGGLIQGEKKLVPPWKNELPR